MNQKEDLDRLYFQGPLFLFFGEEKERMREWFFFFDGGGVRQN